MKPPPLMFFWEIYEFFETAEAATWSVPLKKPGTLLKRESNTGVFQWKLQNFVEYLFGRTFVNNCFLKAIF